MKKITLVLAILFSSAATYADEYLCDYYARISEQDKYNSSGKDLTRSGYTKATVAGIIRQDRANYYVFNKRDPEDDRDCIFHNKKNRALLEKFLKSGRISRATIKTIIEDYPLIHVQIYDRHIEIEIIDIEEGDSAPQSFIR